jgi:hypothetical protein
MSFASVVASPRVATPSGSRTRGLIDSFHWEGRLGATGPFHGLGAQEARVAEVRRCSFAWEGGVLVTRQHALVMDDDKERTRRLLLLAKEQSWRTAWRARSLLSRTTRSSRLATGARPQRTVAERGTR